MRTLTRLRRMRRNLRIRLGKRVKNVPKQLSERETGARSLGDGDGRIATLHPTKGWRTQRA